MTNKAARTGRKLERQVANAYRQMGARKVEHDIEMGGNQIDVYVELEMPGCLRHCIAVEVKDWSRPVGIKVVNEFAHIVGLLRHERQIDEGVIVSASSFSRQARNAAQTYGIQLLEPADLDAMANKAQATGRAQPPALSDPSPHTSEAIPVQPETSQVANTAPTEPTKDPPPTVPPSRTARQTQAASIHQSRDFYSRYETGVRELLGHLGQEHPSYREVLVYQHRLTENIARARRFSDTKTGRVERAEIIEQLNLLTLQELKQSFNDLCSATPEQVESLPELIPDEVLIAAGPFWMGSPLDDPEAYENEKPRHQLNLREYQIGRYPVTNAQYTCFVYQTGHRRPEHWEGGTVSPGLEDHPVVNVNHGDALAYCRWLGQVTEKHYRLPTEEEWEKAARGKFPGRRRYPWGDEWQADICNTQELGRNGTTSVHEFEEHNQSPFGVVDMLGNVWEWTASWYARYPNSSHRSLRYGRLCRVMRGGSWYNPHWFARVSCRGRDEPDQRHPYLGFRVASG